MILAEQPTDKSHPALNSRRATYMEAFCSSTTLDSGQKHAGMTVFD
jgi:hypothetical protein